MLIAAAAIAIVVGVPQLEAQSQTNEPQPASTAPASHAGQQKQHQQQQQDRGEAVFVANCSRCHMPPSGISPRITGSVVMHMRVRARLSRADEQALLHFLAP
jgi:cytochrome c5